MFYNPPVVNRALGIRRSYINEASRVVAGIPEARSADDGVCEFAAAHGDHPDVSAAGQSAAAGQARKRFVATAAAILPNERREIERGLREGRIRGVVTTSAMELGIDVGRWIRGDGRLSRHDRRDLAARRAGGRRSGTSSRSS